MPRKAEMHRKTNETDVLIKINLDGTGKGKIETGIGFFDHLLSSLAKHALFDLEIMAKGDLHIDSHHTVEDVGIVLGCVLDQALGSRKGITRFGHSYCPMDESLARSVVDICGRSFMIFNSKPVLSRIGNFDGDLLPEFLRAVVANGKITLHVDLVRGQNQHHIQESIIKSFAHALRIAVTIDERERDVPSIKGILV